MKNDEMYIDWLKLTAKLIQKYDLDSLSVKVEGSFSLNKDFVPNYKNYVKLNIKDENRYLIKNEYYDILKNNESEEVE